MKYILSIIFYFNCAILQSADIKIGQKIYSPNRKNYIYLSQTRDCKGGYNSYYNIIYYGRKYRLENELPRTFKVLWSKDSNTIFTLNHSYKQTIVQVIKYSDDDWKIEALYPPYKTGYYYWQTTSLIVHENHIIIEGGYETTQYSKNHKYFLGDYKYNFIEGKIYDFQSREVTEQKYSSLIKD